MSNFNTNLHANNIDLQAILDVVNALPNSGSNEVEINLQDKTITENGSYIADSGYDGFGTVTVNVEGGDADHSTEDSLITRTVSNYTNNRVTRIGSYAFYSCLNLTSINFPVCSYIGDNAFQNCPRLISASFPVCSYIGSYAFNGCSSLTSISFPNCTRIGGFAFNNCKNLTNVSFPVCSCIDGTAFNSCSSLISVSFPVCSYIGGNAFQHCLNLTKATFGFDIPSANTSIKVYIYSSAFLDCYELSNLTLYYPSVATLSNINAFASTPMSISTLTGSFGSIYVPASLVNAYKSATNWATYADRITAIGTEPAQLISFTIDGNKYQAEEGMSWEEWIASSYSGAYFIVEGQVVTTTGAIVLNVISSDIILKDGEYYIESIEEPELPTPPPF